MFRFNVIFDFFGSFESIVVRWGSSRKFNVLLILICYCLDCLLLIGLILMGVCIICINRNMIVMISLMVMFFSRLRNIIYMMVMV